MEKQNKTDHPLYVTWSTIWKRCTGTNRLEYKHYGGRGITVSEEWLDFWSFVSDMGPKPSPSYTIDRINNNKGYSRENCRWATRAEQVANRRVGISCQNGHPWTSETTIHTHNGKNNTRRCKVCLKSRKNK